MTQHNTEAIKAFARALGFGPVGITTADDFPAAEQAIVARVDAGLMGDMPWFTAERARLACRPRARFPWARSLVALAVPYYPSPDPALTTAPEAPPQPAAATPVPHLPLDSPLRGEISRYALGQDYHAVVADRLARLAAFVEHLGSAVRTHSYVDTGPVAERAVAARAGLGWFGKNTNLLTPRHGSWVFLAVLFTSLDLTPDAPLLKSCGRCVRCLEACPSAALVAPYVLDASRCLSYLTIELRGSIPRHLRPLLGNLIFGCDICQQVCPVNAKARPGAWPALGPGPSPGPRPALAALLALDEPQFRRRFRHTAVWRAKRVRLQRSVAVALGNSRRREAIPALAVALAHHSPLVRGHAAWALGRIGGGEAAAALRAAAAREPEPAVVEELALALADYYS